MRDQPDILRHTTPPRLKFWRRGGALRGGRGRGRRASACASINDHRAAQWAEDQDVRTVQLIKLLNGAKGGALILPGDVQPLTNAPIYARVSGIVKKWYVDIGTPVKAGELLAETRYALSGGAGAGARPIWHRHRQPETVRRRPPSAGMRFWRRAPWRGRTPTPRTATWPPRTPWSAVGKGQSRSPSGHGILQASGGAVRRHRHQPRGGCGRSGAGGHAAAPRRCSPSPTRPSCASMCACRRPIAGALRRGMTATSRCRNMPGRDFTAKLAASRPARSPAPAAPSLLQFQIDNREGLIKPGDYAEMHFNFPAAPGCGACAGHRADVPRRGHDGGDGGRQQSCEAQVDHHPHATWATRWKSAPVFRRPTG